MSRSFEARTIKAALVSGSIGAVTVEVYLGAAGLLAWPGSYQWIASAIVGDMAHSAPGYAWLGIAIHVAVSLAWGAAWALLASRSRKLRAHPGPYGLAYGVLVFAAMQAALWARGLWTAPTLGLLIHYLVDHAVFFGLPVALAYARLLPPQDQEPPALNLGRRAA